MFTRIRAINEEVNVYNVYEICLDLGLPFNPTPMDV